MVFYVPLILKNCWSVIPRREGFVTSSGLWGWLTSMIMMEVIVFYQCYLSCMYVIYWFSSYIWNCVCEFICHVDFCFCNFQSYIMRIVIMIEFLYCLSTYTKSFAKSGTWNTTFCVSWSHDTAMFFTQGIDDWTALELYPDGSYQIFVAADAPKPNPSWYLWCLVQIVFDFEIGIMKRRCVWCRMLSPMYLAPM